MPLYGCQSPDGYKNTKEVWLNPDGLAQRISFATGIGLGRSPIGERIDAPPARDPYLISAVNVPAAATTPSNAIVASKSTSSVDGPPLDAKVLLATLGGQISGRTRDQIASQGPSDLSAALVLGSPDFMYH